MLTEQDKARIRAEEVFRAELRRELVAHAPAEASAADGPKARKGRILAFLNSAVGMWFLTTVAAGAITTGYQWVDSGLKRQSEIRLSMARIGTELNNRIDEIEQRVSVASTTAEVLAVLNQLDASTIRIFDELKERNLLSLLVELNTQASGGRKGRVQTAIQSARKLERLRDDLRGKEETAGSMPMPTIRAQIMEAVEHLRLACML